MKIEVIKNKTLKDYESWPIWTCDSSEFDWEYLEEEHCYIIKGNVTITHGNGGKVDIAAGDYVIFPKNLKCKWKVLTPVKKHYTFK